MPPSVKTCLTYEDFLDFCGIIRYFTRTCRFGLWVINPHIRSRSRSPESGGQLTCYKSVDYVFASDAFGLKAPGFSRIYYQINNNMITQPKEQYTPPMSEELEIKLEGVMALSGGPYPTWEEEDV